MHILIAPNAENTPLHVWPAGDSRHDVLQLANRPSDAGKVPPVNSWQDLLSRCPIGWQPDVAICWSFEYRPIPEGIEDAECFTVGVIGDWNLGGQALRQAGGAFDLLVADQNGYDRLRAAGFENVLYWPLWAYDPVRHYAIPHVERDLDVVMVGNFNHDIQRERAPWLARVARMSRRHRVLIGSGIYGDAYTHTLNRAKIVFNRSIRGELNMRAYEAAACGALMFYERGNREIGSLFEDGKECVLYSDDDLEELIDFYLENEPARQRIAEAGRKRVAGYTYAAQAAGLFDRIEQLKSEPSPTRRPFSRLTRDERTLRRVSQWLTVATSADLARADELLETLCDGSTDVTERYMAQSCLLALQAQKTDDTEKASRLLHDAVDLSRWMSRISPLRATARLNCAEFLLLQGDAQSARVEYEAALRILATSSPEEAQICGPYFPRFFDAFTVELERLWTEPEQSKPAWRRRVADLLSARCHTRLAELDLSRDAASEATEHARIATSLQPEIGPHWHLLARCHRAAGQLAEAATAYERGFALVPLETGAWVEHLETLQELGAEHEMRALADDLLSLIDGCPGFEDRRVPIARFADTVDDPEAIDTLFAMPDWSSEGAWQPLVGEFARTFRCQGDVTLALLVDPGMYPDLMVLTDAIQGYLIGTESLFPHEWPDLHLIHQSADSLELTLGSDWIDAIVPSPAGPSANWLRGIPRMTVKTFRLAFKARRPAPISRAA
jgi:tetratricopeptide (TPR) repeat protein